MIIMRMGEHRMIHLIQSESDPAGILRVQPVSSGVQEHLYASEFDKATQSPLSLPFLRPDIVH